MQGFVEECAASVAAELSHYDAHPDYRVDRLPDELYRLDERGDWLWLAQLYLIEQFHHMIATGAVELRRDGEHYWIDPLDLTDTNEVIAGELILAAVASGGRFGRGTGGAGLSAAGAHSATARMPAPHNLLHGKAAAEAAAALGYTQADPAAEGSDRHEGAAGVLQRTDVHLARQRCSPWGCMEDAQPKVATPRHVRCRSQSDHQLAMFSIHFYPVIGEPDTVEARGVIVLGDFVEDFFSTLATWDRSSYEAQWREAIEQVLDGEASGLFTDFFEPSAANFLRWWPMYPMDANVRFHEALLFVDELGEPFDLRHLSRYALPYENESEDGPVSEWAVDRADLARFLGRRLA